MDKRLKALLGRTQGSVQIEEGGKFRAHSKRGRHAPNYATSYIEGRAEELAKVKPGAYSAKGLQEGIEMEGVEVGAAPAIEWARVLGDYRAIKQAILWTAPGVSADETRYFMCGVHIEAGAIVSTDGRTLMVQESDFIAGGHEPLILPPEPALLWALENLTLTDICRGKSMSSTYLRFSFLEFATELSIACIDGQFPNWRRVVPDYSGEVDTIEIPSKDELKKQALALRLAKNKSGRVQYTSAKGLSVAFNVAFIQRAFDAGIKRLEGQEADRAWVARDGARLYVVMPMMMS